MLPPANRMRSREDFARALRGRRVASGPLVTHLARTGTDEPARIGLAVSRSVGSSVVRHRVARRLRHLLRLRLDRFAPGVLLVVRALPAAATATSAQLGVALDSALDSGLGAGLNSGLGAAPVVRL
ncbi:MAG TPA: ribonuclease P protein component [Actinomycetes bacterium]|nr:ribonuclease P protein component [Actinomycetes bacterium]